jgi:hypothetical protein
MSTGAEIARNAHDRWKWTEAQKAEYVAANEAAGIIKDSPVMATCTLSPPMLSSS